MTVSAPQSFGAQLRALREAAGFTQEELATIAGLSVHAVSALERGERRHPHVETVRALSAALDLTGAACDALLASARASAHRSVADELSHAALPIPPTAILGREPDLETLRRWIGDPAVRLITLLGPGGVGKTRLALELARTVDEEGAFRVVFVPLAAVTEPARVAASIAEALGLAEVSAVDLPKSLKTACGQRPMLLVLDNCEQVPDAAGLVGDLLAFVARLRIVATSRAPLRLRGERQYSVGPLALPLESETSTAERARAPAVRLFIERVRSVDPGFRLTAANARAINAICQRLDGLPLALELAAPWIKVLTVEHLLRHLEHDVLLSTATPRDLPERQQTMNATVSWSYQLLAHDEQRVFRRLGVLPSRFPLEAASAVARDRNGHASKDGVLEVVARLIDKSLLLRAETSTPRRPLYRMLETVRAYAIRELTASGERDEALEGLAGYCEREASLASEGLIGPDQAGWLDRVRDDLESYRSALTWLIGRRHSAEASIIACGLMFFWMLRGHAAEGLEWYDRILELQPLSPSVESQVLLGASAMLYTRGDMERVRTNLARSVRLANDVGDLGILAPAEDLFGHADHALGNLDAARERLTRSLQLFRDRAIPWGIGDALSGLAGVALASGDMIKAEALLDEATATLGRAGPWFLLLTLYVRAVLAVRRGRPDEAITWVREGLTRIRQLHDKFAFVYTLVPLAAAAALLGEDAWAARVLGARDAVTERTGAAVVDKSVDDLRERAERDTRARLGPDRWARAYAAGRVISLDAMLKDIESRQARGSA